MLQRPKWLGSRFWGKIERAECWKLFDTFARSREPVYNTEASAALNADRLRVGRLLSILQDDGTEGEGAVDPDVSLALTHDRITSVMIQEFDSKAITDESLRQFMSALDGAELEAAREWFNRFQALNSTTASITITGLAAELGINVSDIFDPGIAAEIFKRTNLLAGRVTGATWDAVRFQVLSGIGDGWSTQRMALEINKVFGQGLHRVRADGTLIQILSPQQRALLIARTETTAITNAASLRGVQGSGLDLWKSWVSQGDDRVREAHLSEESETEEGIPPEDAFPVTGLEYPSEPNCRCTLFYIDPPKNRARRGGRQQAPSAAPRAPVRRGSSIGGPLPSDVARFGNIGAAEFEELEAGIQAILKKSQAKVKRLSKVAQAKWQEVLKAMKAPPGSALSNEMPALRTTYLELDKLTGVARASRKGQVHAFVKAKLDEFNPGRPHAEFKFRQVQGTQIKKTTKLGKSLDGASTFLNEQAHHNLMGEIGKFSGTPEPWRDLDIVKIGRGERAYHQNGVVHLAPSDGPNIALHEVGHLIEERHQFIGKEAGKFLRARRTPGTVSQPLREMVAHSGYDAAERAWLDEFIDAYVGKVYSSGFGRTAATEITSMGLEYYFQNPLRLLREDPGHFQWIMNVLSWDGVVP